MRYACVNDSIKHFLYDNELVGHGINLGYAEVEEDLIGPTQKVTLCFNKKTGTLSDNCDSETEFRLVETPPGFIRLKACPQFKFSIETARLLDESKVSTL